jgi:hypothetical protein
LGAHLKWENKQTAFKLHSPLAEINQDLMSFLAHYNLYRRHNSLRRELNVKTPFNAVEKWPELDPKY